MKKSLLALAVAGAVVPVLAQADTSNVTVYGRLNNSFEHRTEKVGDTSNSGNRVRANNSRIGFKGSEDLGNGLKANFQLELGWDSDVTGTGLSNTRRSWVGLSGGFGSFLIGRQSGPFDDQYDENTAQINHDTGTTGQQYYPGAGRFSNGMRYDSPNWGGFKLGAAYAHNGTTNDNISGADGVKESSRTRHDLALTYGNGPLSVGYAYEKNDTGAAGAKESVKLHQLVGAYDFGPVYLSALFNTGKNDREAAADTKIRYYQLGFSVPFASAFDVTGNWAHRRDKVDGGTTTKSRQAQIGVGYKFSKRTRTVAYWDQTKVTDDAGSATAKNTTYGVALRHNF